MKKRHWIFEFGKIKYFVLSKDDIDGETAQKLAYLNHSIHPDPADMYPIVTTSKAAEEILSQFTVQTPEPEEDVESTPDTEEEKK